MQTATRQWDAVIERLVRASAVCTSTSVEVHARPETFNGGVTVAVSRNLLGATQLCVRDSLGLMRLAVSPIAGSAIFGVRRSLQPFSFDKALSVAGIVGTRFGAVLFRIPFLPFSNALRGLVLVAVAPVLFTRLLFLRVLGAPLTSALTVLNAARPIAASRQFGTPIPTHWLPMTFAIGGFFHRSILPPKLSNKEGTP
jgi:hypothetical protein